MADKQCSALVCALVLPETQQRSGGQTVLCSALLSPLLCSPLLCSARRGAALAWPGLIWPGLADWPGLAAPGGLAWPARDGQRDKDGRERRQ